LAFQSGPSSGEGAIALGIEKSAIGWSWGYPSAEQAAGEAMKECRQYIWGQDTACKIVERFRGRCFAVAIANEIGWAVASNKQVARQRALDACNGESTKAAKAPSGSIADLAAGKGQGVQQNKPQSTPAEQCAIKAAECD
jgi:hypothetical protein